MGIMVSYPSVKNHDIFTKENGFSMHLTVAPTKGGAVLVWLGCAPLGKEVFRQACSDKGVEVLSSLIPTYGIKLPLAGPQSKTEYTGHYLPLEQEHQRQGGCVGGQLGLLSSNPTPG